MSNPFDTDAQREEVLNLTQGPNILPIPLNTIENSPLCPIKPLYGSNMEEKKLIKINNNK